MGEGCVVTEIDPGTKAILKRILFPVQRAAVIVASRVQNLFIYFTHPARLSFPYRLNFSGPDSNTFM